jgi:hypothetical protein
MGQVWNEVGDAPQVPSPGQITTGSGPLTTINGNLSSITDVDMFCIVVTDPHAFGAAVATSPAPTASCSCSTPPAPA